MHSEHGRAMEAYTYKSGVGIILTDGAKDHEKSCILTYS